MGTDPRASGFRSPRPEDYPELAGYSRDDPYREAMGGGRLYLAARMTRPPADGLQLPAARGRKRLGR